MPLDPRIAQQYMLHMHQQRQRSPHHHHHHHHHPPQHRHHHPGAKSSALGKGSATAVGPGGPGGLGVGVGGGQAPSSGGQVGGQVGSPPTGLSPQGLPQVQITACDPSEQQVGFSLRPPLCPLPSPSSSSSSRFCLSSSLPLNSPGSLDLAIFLNFKAGREKGVGGGGVCKTFKIV